MRFFEIENIALELMNYEVSYIELIGILSGLLSVIFAAKIHFWTWIVGIINEFFLFILFFQVQLYADMFLQVFFFLITVYGWYNWRKEGDIREISMLSKKENSILLSLVAFMTCILGYFFSQIHLFFPTLFKEAASFPFMDSLVMTLSVIATFLLAHKKIETWFYWLCVDIICVFLFYRRGIYFLAFEYLIFLLIVVVGLYNWKKQLKNG